MLASLAADSWLGTGSRLLPLDSGTALTSIDRFAQELRIWRVRVREKGRATESETERKRVSARYKERMRERASAFSGKT